MLIAVFTACSRPTHSSTEWAPWPPVSSRTRSTAASPRSLTTSVAPKSFASAMRSAWRPRITICSAPSRFAAMTPHNPTAPSPTTATLFPGVTLAIIAAWCPVPITSESVSNDAISASSACAPSGKRVPSANGIRTASACAPATSVVPKNPPWIHDVWSPSWQNAHVPSENANGIITKSPRLILLTSAPTSSTTPIASCPITRPVSLRSIFWYGHKSLPQIHARVTRMRASVGSMICGSGTFSIRTSPALYITVARIMVGSKNLLSLRFQRSHVDRKAVLHVRLQQSLVGFVDLLNRNDFDLGGDVVFAAEIEHLLGFRNAANTGPGKTATPHDQAECRDIQWFCGSTDQRKITINAEQIDIGVDVVIGRNGVDDEVEATGVVFHFVGVPRNDSFIGAETERVLLLVRRGREDDNVRSERMSKLHRHVTKSTETDHANFFTLADAPVADRRVRCDPRTQERCGASDV